MKRIVCLLLAVAMVGSLAACGKTTTPQTGNQIGDRCPATQLTEINQNGYTDHIFDPTERGKITVINFWAYWCPPCVRELPHFERVAVEYTDEVDVIAVHCDSVAKAQTFIEENYPDCSIIFAIDKGNDPYAYYSALGGNGSIPYTVVLDVDGIVRKTFVGAIDYDTLKSAIQDCR